MKGGEPVPKYMTKEEKQKHDERHKEDNLRFIRAKLPGATARELSILASFIRGPGVVGWSDSEYFRDP